jgi:RecA-family ATPase
MCELGNAGQAIDIITLTEVLNAHKELGVVWWSWLHIKPHRWRTAAAVNRSLRSHRSGQGCIAEDHLPRAEHSIESLRPRGLTDEIIQEAQKQLLDFALMSGEGEKDIFVDVTEFCKGTDVQPDWVIEGLIERGSNGIVAADPKGAKSLTVAGNMSVCLALGIPWLGMPISRRVKVALVSREDNPETTKRRIRQIVRGKGGNIAELEGYLHINSKAQSKSLMLDNPREVNNLIRCLKRWGSEFVILDVFNKLHVQDENDNTKVRAVMNQIDRIQAETGAQICVLHHWNKGDANQSLTRRIRGAGAIAGFAEWIAGIELEDEKSQIRTIRFETKVGEYVKPISFQITDLPTQEYQSASALLRLEESFLQLHIPTLRRSGIMEAQ